MDSPIAILASECLSKCNGASLNEKTITVRPYTDKKESLDKKKSTKEKKEKKPKENDVLSKDDPFYVSSSDDEDEEEEDKPDKNGIFPNRVLVVARLAKSMNWDQAMQALQEKFSKIGKLNNIRMPKQGRLVIELLKIILNSNFYSVITRDMLLSNLERQNMPRELWIGPKRIQR